MRYNSGVMGKQGEYETTKEFEKFKKYLREMFRLDGAEDLQLDFGIYRVVKQRAERIEKQLIEQLPKMAENTLAAVSQQEKTTADEDFQLQKQKVIKDFGADKLDNKDDLNPELANTPLGKKYIAAKKAASKHKSQSSNGDIFNHLLDFFARYYEGGDFMPRRRIRRGGAYSLPYNGEDVMLHWANRHQYYVKTANRFLSCTFPFSAGKVKFVVRDTDALPENNNKGGAKFFFPQIAAATMQGNTLEIPLEYRALLDGDGVDKKGNKLQERINEKAVKAAESALLKKLGKEAHAELFHESEDEKNMLFRHLERYCRGNDSDFFIHKDLSAFLSGELDSYIKTEILDLEKLEIGGTDALDGQGRLVLAVRKLGGEIIARLGELEDFQKKVWEKKKFIFGTNYIVRLGALSDAAREALLPEIVACDKQWREWQALGIVAAGKKAERERILRDAPSLPLDTANFGDNDFRDRLIATFDDLEESIDGVCFHSENWQALNLMSGKYAGKIRCIHIDPPYNTNTSGFLYKNNFKHSSWMAMMENRITAALPLLADDGVFQCHIDENEYERLGLFFDETSMPNAGTVIWDKKNPMLGGGGISVQHEYIAWRAKEDRQFYLKNTNIKSMLAKVKAIIRKSGGVNENARKEFHQWIKENSKLTGGEKSYHYLDDDGAIYQSVAMVWPNIKPAPKEFFIPLVHPKIGKPCPVPPRGWSQSPAKMKGLLAAGEVIFGKDEKTQPRRKIFLTEESQIRISTILRNGSRGLTDIENLGMNFPYCHPVSLYEDVIGAGLDGGRESAYVLDYFAGSGTAAHAVINLNRRDGGRRKFILAEMGDYFDTVLLPRIKKAIYSSTWKNGKPAENGNGNGILPDEAAARAPRLVAYHRLESYEDALENIKFEGEGGLILDGGERYMWEWESRDNITFAPPEKLRTPFDFKIKRVGKDKDAVAADLPDTFNFMAGMRLRTRRVFFCGKRRYQFDIGMLDGKPTICVWRDIGKWEKKEYEKDRDFIRGKVKEIGKELSEYAAAQVLTNGAAGDYISLDPLFHKLMFGKEE